MRDQHGLEWQADFSYAQPRIFPRADVTMRMIEAVAVSPDQRSCYIGDYNDVLMTAINRDWDFYTLQRDLFSGYIRMVHGVM